MGMDPQLRAQLRQTMYVSAPGDLDPFGNPTGYGEPIERRARIRDLQKVITDRTGQQVVASVELITDLEIGLNDRIWLPGANMAEPNEARTPKNRENLFGERGEYVATKVWL